MEVNNADINSVCFGILCNFTPTCGEDRAKEAVAIVRSLQAENKKLYKLIEEHQKLLHAYQDVVIPGHKKWIEQLKKERDAAVSDLETIIAYGGGNLDTCQFCKNAKCYARGGTKLCTPEWRGSKGEDEDFFILYPKEETDG